MAQEMPNDPGNPDNTDPEFTSPNEAEQAAEEAAKAQADARADAAEEVAIDPELEAEVDEALAGVEEQEAVPDVEAQLAERTEDLQRVSAEYANYRRRTERERTAAVEAAKAKVITEFLPLLDDLELAKQHGDLDEGPLKAFADKLNNVLAGQKLEAFGAEGDEFDPEIHEAVQDLSEGDDKRLGTVLRKGYRLGDRLVRNAMVIIADPQETQAPEAE
ncbi:heat shock protein GrpE [Corynebacterium pilosum]|uniref:Protein GrpE n=2 Tax=Corynebacterium pilosum TaxID=35756 RepID=A0A376CLF7_9CORY|nr:nucleotide exchange factor GrpE [Corynebacterium pilosum]STC68949.1 heat shock protein GrpE [Corynebacterium pilosum]